jgi:hypothetical protein
MDGRSHPLWWEEVNSDESLSKGGKSNELANKSGIAGTLSEMLCEKVQNFIFSRVNELTLEMSLRSFAEEMLLR